MTTRVGESIEKIGDCVVPLVNKLDRFLGSAKFSKALPYGLGAALDFAGQLLGSEELGDAVNGFFSGLGSVFN